MQRERNKVKSDQVRKTGFPICKSFSYSYVLTNFFMLGSRLKTLITQLVSSITNSLLQKKSNTPLPAKQKILDKEI